MNQIAIARIESGHPGFLFDVVDTQRVSFVSDRLGGEVIVYLDNSGNLFVHTSGGALRIIPRLSNMVQVEVAEY